MEVSIDGKNLDGTVWVICTLVVHLCHNCKRNMVWLKVIIFFRYLQVRHFVRTHLGHPLQASQVSQRLHNGEECNFSYVHTLHTMPQTGRFLDSSVFIFLKCLQDYIKARSRSGSTGNLQNRQHQLLSYGLLCGKKNLFSSNGKRWRHHLLKHG